MGSPRVTMVLKTVGLEYDDRVRKECQSLLRAGFEVRLIVLQRQNEAEERTLWGGVAATSVSLVTRRLFKHGRGLAFKLAEFNLRGLALVLRNPPDVLWLHNEECAPLVAVALLLRRLGCVERVVWDQHELPSARVLNRDVLRRAWGRLMGWSDVVVVANRERRGYLMERFAPTEIRFAVLENRTDRTFQESPGGSLPDEVRKWARGRPYLLLQGGAHPGRHFEEVVTALMDHVRTEIGALVVGGYSEPLVAELRRRWDRTFDDRVFFTGWVPQMAIPTLVDHAVGSLILYEADSPNTYYCAPNRLYQAIARQTPVIVGSNPPLASLVSRHGLGVVLDGTGSSPRDIARGIEELLADPTRYDASFSATVESLGWEQQQGEIIRTRDG